MQALREMLDSMGAMGPISRMDFLQADNQMRTFAKETGGQAFFPRFEGEFGSIFQIDPPGAAQPVRVHVLAYQQGARRNVSQDQSGTGESRHQRTAAGQGRKGQAGEVFDRGEEPATKPRAPSSKVKNSISRFFQDDVNPLTVYYSSVTLASVPNEILPSHYIRTSSWSMTIGTDCWSAALLEEQGYSVQIAVNGEEGLELFERLATSTWW